MPDVGIVELRDAETGERVWVDTSSKTVRDHYASSWRHTSRSSRRAAAQPGRQRGGRYRRGLRRFADEAFQTAVASVRFLFLKNVTRVYAHMLKMGALAALTLGAARPSRAADPVVSARFSADSVMIGDQFSLDIRVDKDVMEVVDFPVFNGFLSDSADIEILAESPVDTLKAEGRRITLGKSYLLAGFDEGRYRMGRFPVLRVDKNLIDTVWSRDSLAIDIHTLPVDTLTQTIHDVKPPLRTPLRFAEIRGWLILGWLAAVAVIAAVLLVRRRMELRALPGGRRPASRPHVCAIRQLETLHNQKLWQSGKQKQYYTGITDILRRYIGDRYRVKAMELTSQEILDEMERQRLSGEAADRLKNILLTADFVKFAKFVADAERNEEVYSDAYYFVEQTKETEVEHTPAELEPVQKQEEVKP